MWAGEKWENEEDKKATYNISLIRRKDELEKK
jgi:hypothetical protein